MSSDNRRPLPQNRVLCAGMTTAETVTNNVDPPVARRRGPAEMTDEHKAALALGREQSRVVRDYLDALRSAGSTRGPKPDAEKMRRRLAVLDAELERPTGVDTIWRLRAVQERIDLRAKLDRLGDGDDDASLAAREEAFVGVAADYSRRAGISFEAWRQVGVSRDVLHRAGLRGRA